MKLTDDRCSSTTDTDLLAADARRRILAVVQENGGHLASSLGAVELSIALTRAFNPSVDRIVWDVGHQAYAWKLLTGRADRFATLRRYGGISGFPNPDESPCDAFVAGHAGSALAAAEGMAVARDRKGGAENVVAVVGDAALLNGMALEALNTCRILTRRLILVVNDNGSAATSCPLDALMTACGWKCLPAVDGHDVAAMTRAFEQAKAADFPVAVRVKTVKGKGFPPAEADPEAWHGVRSVAAGEGADSSDEKDWSAAFGAAAVAAAARDSKVCALTAAMRNGTGLAAFAQRFPDRFFDVGICEELLVTFAAGLAKGGMRPMVAVYSTFLQRAVDQVMHDVCLQNLPVVFGIDRAGAVGADGRTHHGMFDIPMLRCLPNLSILQPCDTAELEKMLALALAHGTPVAIRYPRGATESIDETMCKDRLPVEWGKAEPLSNPESNLQLWALGDQVRKALAVAKMLATRGIEAGVVNARFVKPFDKDLLARQRASGMRIVSLENGSVAGGFGEAIGADLRCGWPDEYIAHGTIDELESAHGFTTAAIAGSIEELGLHLQQATC